MMGPARLLGGVHGMLQLLFLLLCTLPAAQPTDGPALSPSTSTSTTRLINIGAVLSSRNDERKFVEAITKINKEHGALPPKVQLGRTQILMDSNPITMSGDICKKLITKKVSVVIASKKEDSDLSSVSVSFTCGFYRIPVIGIAARESVFSDKTVHNSFLRTVPPYSDQASAWVELVIHFQWTKVIFVHSSDGEGRAMLASFQSSAEGHHIEIEKIVSYTPGLRLNKNELKELSETESQVFLLYASTSDAAQIYKDARKYNMTKPGFVWIVTEQALKARNVPTGVVGLSLSVSTEEAHISDSVRVIAQGLKAMLKHQELTDPPRDCNASARAFLSGPTLYKYLKKVKLVGGMTGDLDFDDAGDRLNPTYDVINVVSSKKKTIGSYRGSLEDDKLQVNETVVWPGRPQNKPKGIKISTHLQVVTIEELPFIYVTPVPPGSKCNVELNKRACPKPNITGGPPQEFCCYGYAIDLLDNIAKTVNFTYDLHLVADGSYGSYEVRNSSKKEWNGMIGELIHAKADLIVAPLTMDPQRAQYIDFSKPFKYQGLTILVKKTTKDSSLGSLLQPFQNLLWILVGLSVHVVALVLYLLDRFSPFGRFKLAKSDDTEEDALNLSSAMWFAWGVLLNSGIGEGTPRSFSARVLGMVWAGFAMIIVASYTANLAAFLVLDRPEASISGIDDARLRNPQENSKYATVKNSAVAMYFKRQVELSTMYRAMAGRNYDKPEDAIRDVKEGKDLHAFIWDSSRLEYEAANDCDLVTAGDLFGRSAYGIGLKKGSPWTQDVSLAVLSFHESGYMEQLEGKWILVKDTKCPEKDTSPATLGLPNMAGVFMIVAGGIVAGVFLIFVEIAYKRHRGLKEKELELAKTAADRWRGNIEKRRTLRRNLLQQQQQQQQQQPDIKQRTNGTSSPGPPKLAAFNKTVIANIGGGSTSASGYQRVPATVTHEIKDVGTV